MPSRTAVVLVLPRRPASRLEAFRRAHDPLAGRIAARVTLVFPFEGRASTAIRRRLGAAVRAADGPFRVGLRHTGRYHDGSVHLRVGAGTLRLVALHRTLTTAAGSPLEGPWPAYRPHVTVARPAEAAAARRVALAAARLGPLGFLAREVSIVEEDRRGRWREAHRIPLGLPLGPAPRPGAALPARGRRRSASRDRR